MKISPLVKSLLLSLAALPLMAQVAPPAAPRTRPSPPDTAYATVEGAYPNGKGVLIYYSRPNQTLNGEKRKIWGTLVPFNTIWRLGANEATLLVTPLPLQFGDLAVPAGAYSLYMLPSDTGDSKLIINKMVGQVGTVYDEKQDLGRITLKREDLATPVEQLIIALTPSQPAGTTTLKIAWESTQYSIPFIVKK